jgi:hypothetical protein
MATSLSQAKDGATYVVPVSFTDEDGSAVTPNSIQWSLRNEDGTIVNSRTSDSETPSTSVNIVLQGADLLYSDGHKRVITVEATYNSTLGTSLPMKGEAEFFIDDLVGV